MRRVGKTVLAAALGLLTAMGTAQSADAARDRYVFILTALNNPYWDSAEAGIREAARAQAIDAVIYRTQDATAAEEQLNICLTAIEQHPKVIVMAAITPGVGLQCLKKAADAEIIVADIDSNTTVEDARRAHFSLAFSVGSDNTLLGAKAADYAATLEPEAAPHVLVLEGGAGSVPGAKRLSGFTDRLKQVKPQAVITALPANWDTIKAMNATNDTLQRDPALHLIFAANDTMALGAAEAVKNAGKTGEIAIIGIDGIEAARKAVLAGTLSASVAQLPYLMGKRAVELAVAAVNTGKTGMTEVTPTPVLTKQVLQANSDRDLQYVR